VDIQLNTNDRSRTASPTPTRRLSSFSFVYWAAGIGMVLFAFEAYLLVKWATGPNFKTVPYGPSEPPLWMKWGMNVYQPVGIALTLYCFWRLLIRPWVRERRVTFFGLLCPVLLLTSIYDPLGAYFHPWYGYNAYFLNYGSPLPGGVPGWQGFAEPGAMIAWPIIMIPTIYVLVFMLFIWSGAALMRWLRNRFERMPPILVACCFVAFVAFDVFIEGNVMMRLGWYAETGLSINEGTYYQNPWRNILLAALMWTVMACLWYFRDDHGNTLVERGLRGVRRDSGKGIVLRFFAVLAAIQLILIIFYQVPMALYEKHQNGHWPESISTQTYLNDHQCGYDTPRPCP
jgi:hypothetical protein